MKKRIMSFVLTFVLAVGMLSVVCMAQVETDVQQAINNAIQNCVTTINLAPYNLKNTEQNRQMIHNYVLLDNPEFFHVSHAGFNIDITGDNITAISGINYTCNKAQYDAMLLELRSAATSIVNKVSGFGDQYTKALLLHDAIALLCEYDAADNAPYGHTAYGALVGKKAVCEGYSNAYEYLLNMVGIKNELCMSEQLGHEWNVVYIDGIPYHVDVTFDDPLPNVYGRVLHSNFLVSTATLIQRGHGATDITNTAPQDTRYDNANHTKILSAIVTDGTNQYYSQDSAVYKNGTVIATVDANWTYDGQQYLQKFVSVALDGGYVYYNDNKSVYKIDANGQVNHVVTPAINDANIYGMHIVNGVIYMQYSKTAEDNNKAVATFKVSDVKPQKEIINTVGLFSDVAQDWYTYYVNYAYTYGIFKGNPDGTFKPLSNITRAEFVQVLANISGIDTSNKNITQVFTDVKSGDWFAPAVMWAYNNGVVAGLENNCFGPEQNITREQMCVMIVNYAEKYKSIKLGVVEAKENFVDDSAISDWAKDEVYICQMADIVNGKGDGRFDPQGTGLRAEASVIFTKFHQGYLQ